MKVALSAKNLWTRMPESVKAILSPALRLVPPRVLLGRRFARCLRFAREAQAWPIERAREYQLARLRAIVEWAWRRTTFYRRNYDAIGFRPEDLRGLEDMRGLPLIDKETVRKHLGEMCAIPLACPGIDYVSTGGSSGPPLRFYIGADRSAIEYGYLVASWERAGYRMETPQAVIRGQIVPKDSHGLRHTYDPILRRHCYSNFHMSPENMQSYLDHIRNVGSCFLHVYPSAVHRLALFVRAAGIQPPENVRGIIAESENVDPDSRKFVEATFRCRYFSCYGHSEKLVLGAECEHSSDYHVWPTYGYFELLDEENQPVTTPGRQGEIVGTGFINRVVPFIRYRTGDYATYVADRCTACGRQQTVISRVVGRWPQGSLLAANGSPVSMTALNMHDDTLEGVHDYQFVQRVPGEATLRLVPIGDLSPAQQQAIANRVNQRCQGQVRIAVEVCLELSKTSTGKQPRVVSELDEALLAQMVATGPNKGVTE